MDSAFDKRGDSHLPGSALRNEAASYLEAIHGNASIETIIEGKKIDITCTVREYGKPTDLLVEVKDLAGNLSREDASRIYADYLPLLAKARSGRLLLVTRMGLTPAAQAYVESLVNMFHQTIWELEDAALGLLPYVRAQVGAFDEELLSSYYVPARARQAVYDEEQHRSLDGQDVALLDAVEQWIDESGAPPLAILGGYGAGKSSFAKCLLSRQAKRALDDPAARRPVLIKLGAITRSTGLDSLLGSLFTSEFEVRGYSFRRFKELNEKGRLLVILDGFDEMKHAMTWTEFVNEIGQLNQLNAGDARVLLLGRPSAFTSDDEHLEVLRGRRRTEAGTRRLLNWPEFREYELEAFTREERADFVARFLLALEAQRLAGTEHQPDLDAATRRAEEVNRLADIEQEVFGKPVHARILVELALDPDFDLSSFARGVTRWTLYSEFFQLLARRETQRPARSPIESRHRLEFLRRVALWLWRERDGATSFRAAELPRKIYDDLPGGDAQEPEDKRREYLAGAFLERKANDTYYFPHRSFAEFLIAEHLALHPPASGQHRDYDLLARDGVAEFLSAAPASQNIAGWAETLTSQSGRLTIEYILLLVDIAGSFDALCDRLPEDSPWGPLLRLLGTKADGIQERRRILADAILKASHETVALLLAGLARFFDLIPTSADGPADVNPLGDLTEVTTAALISRVMGAVRETTPMSRLTVEEKAAPMLRLLQAAVSLEQDEHARYFVFSWPRLANAAAQLIDRSGPSVELPSGSYDYATLPDERVTYFAVRQIMSAEVSEFFHQMVLRRGTPATISIVSHVERRGSGAAHRE